MNEIEIYQGNTNTIICTVAGLDNLIGYTATLTVKKDIRDIAPLIDTVGLITGLTIEFNTSASQNTLPTGRYAYDITIADGTKVYTVAQSTYKITDSVKY